MTVASGSPRGASSPPGSTAVAADQRPDAVNPALSQREVEVLDLVAQGLTNQEIAENLFLSIPTVETHRRNIFHKLDCRNIAGLVKYAMERGWGH